MTNPSVDDRRYPAAGVLVAGGGMGIAGATPRDVDAGELRDHLARGGALLKPRPKPV